MMDEIASSFAATRQVPWGPVVDFLAGIDGPGRLLDVGGANGRHALVARERGFDVLVSDVSGGLLRVGRGGPGGLDVGWIEADLLRTPFASGVFDGALCIAVVHCIRGRAARVAALRELRRVTREGASAMVSVWARHQPRFSAHRRDERAGAEDGDIMLPWKRDVHAPVDRFFHVYEEQEFRDELLAAGWVVDAVQGVDLTKQGTVDNWFATVRA